MSVGVRCREAAGGDTNQSKKLSLIELNQIKLN